jgi:uncharacterized membrane protein YebE (DUF533 family)
VSNYLPHIYDMDAASKDPEGFKEAAAEVYLASVLMVDQASFMERAYLDALARELRLAPGLQRELEAQAAAA